MEDHDGTRRNVLLGIGAGIAVGAAGIAVAQRRRSAGTDRKPGYAIVGLGSYATKQIMPAFKDCQHARLAGLVSGTPDKLKRYAEEYGIPSRNLYNYSNFDTIRDNPDIDIVYVILPNSMHAEYGIRAARAGKHVLCEKPMAVSAAECRAMIAASRQAGKKLMIGYRSRFEPHNMRAIDLVRKRHVGPARVIVADHGFNAAPGQWRLDRPMSGGGSLMDIGIYSLNATRYLTGEEPELVSAIESTDRSDPRFRTVEDRIDFLLRFPSGVIANCTSSYSSHHNRYRITGSDGFIDLDPATAYAGQKMTVSRKGKDEPANVEQLPGTQFSRQLDHLAECVLTGRDPIVPGEEGLADLRVIEAIYRSAKEGRAIRLGAA